MSGHSDWCFGTPVGATALLSCAHAHFDRCFDTPAGTMELLLRGQARPDRCFRTPAGATTLLLRGQARPVRCYGTSVLYCTFGYLCAASYSFLMIGLVVKQLYDKTLNKE